MSGLEHQVAIDISRALNLVNANDLLARQVIQIARNHKQVGGFVKGKELFDDIRRDLPTLQNEALTTHSFYPLKNSMRGIWKVQG